jgi:hypothetical protein
MAAGGYRAGEHISAPSIWLVLSFILVSLACGL